MVAMYKFRWKVCRIETESKGMKGKEQSRIDAHTLTNAFEPNKMLFRSHLIEEYFEWINVELGKWPQCHLNAEPKKLFRFLSLRHCLQIQKKNNVPIFAFAFDEF